MVLPPSYPVDSPPHLISIRATHLWLPRVVQLQDVLTQMWQPGEGILCAWTEFIRSGDFLRSLSSTANDTFLWVPSKKVHSMDAES